MGVMSCSKRNCDNIMCDTYVNHIGYICDNCKNEFKSWLYLQTPLYLDSDSFIKEKLSEFMDLDTESNLSKDIDNSVDKFFKN